MTDFPRLTLQDIEYHIKRSTNQTEFEKRWKIYNVGYDITFDSNCLKIYRLHKSDGTHTLALAFKVGLNSPYWLLWNITEQQAKQMISIFPKIYEETNKHNEKYWKRRDSCENSNR